MIIAKSFEVMNSRAVKGLMKLLNEEFGVKEKLGFVFLRNAKDKVYVVNRDIDSIDLNKIWIDSLGLYFGKFQSDGFRPSIEGSQIIAKYATKNILELNQEQKHEWMKGHDVSVEWPDELVLIKSGNDFLGSGKVKNNSLLNAIPKSRRLNTVNESFSE